MNTRATTFGDHLRQWRRRRQLSQEALADRANLSPRHLSFLETGRANPSREMVLRLAERLDSGVESDLLLAGLADVAEGTRSESVA